jgi:hypothetical protein
MKPSVGASNSTWAVMPTSPPRLAPSASREAQESAWLVGAFLSSSAYGVVLALFVLNFYLLLQRVRSSSPKHHRTKRDFPVMMLLAFVAVEFIAATLSMVSHVEKSRLAFVVHRDYPGGPAMYQDETPMSSLGLALLLVINWSSDGLLVSASVSLLASLCAQPQSLFQLWRCFAFYTGASFAGSRQILVIPCIMYILSIGELYKEYTFGNCKTFAHYESLYQVLALQATSSSANKLLVLLPLSSSTAHSQWDSTSSSHS